MKFKITYYTLGDSLVTKEVTAPSQKEAIKILADDPQALLGQVMNVYVIKEEIARYFYNASTGQFIQLAGLNIDNPFSADWSEVDENKFNQLVAQAAIEKLKK